MIIILERLKIRVLPTLCLVSSGKTRDFIVGFTDLGNTDEFSTEMLEWRVARSGLIEYSGDLLTPPSQSSVSGKQNMKVHKKTIRGRENDSDDTDSD